MIGNLGKLGIIGRISLSSSKSSMIYPPSGFLFITRSDGTYLTNAVGNYLVRAI